jgi:hypothetical protein
MARFGTRTHDDIPTPAEMAGDAPEEINQPSTELGVPLDGNGFQEDTPATALTDVNDLTGLPPAETVPELPEHDAEATGAKTRRGRPKMGDLPEVTLDDLPDAVEVPESEWESAPLDEKKVIERSAAQMKIDAAVKAVYDKWVEKDKPAARTAPRMSYEVKPELAATTSAMITRAGVFHKVRVVKSGTHTPQGMARITFSAIDRPPVTKKDDKK